MRHDNTAQLSYQIQNLITVAWLLLKYDKIRLPLYLNYHRKFACEMGHITLTGIVHAMVALNHRYLKMVAILPTVLSNISCLLQWRNNYRAGVSNHRRLDCLLNRLFRRESKKIKTPCHWYLWGEYTGDRWTPRTEGQKRGKCFHLMMSPCERCFLCILI